MRRRIGPRPLPCLAPAGTGVRPLPSWTHRWRIAVSLRHPSHHPGGNRVRPDVSPKKMCSDWSKRPLRRYSMKRSACSRSSFGVLWPLGYDPTPPSGQQQDAPTILQQQRAALIEKSSPWLAARLMSCSALSRLGKRWPPTPRLRCFSYLPKPQSTCIRPAASRRRSGRSTWRSTRTTRVLAPVRPRADPS